MMQVLDILGVRVDSEGEGDSLKDRFSALVVGGPQFEATLLFSGAMEAHVMMLRASLGDAANNFKFSAKFPQGIAVGPVNGWISLPACQGHVRF